jgi:hypothetical protein
VSRHLLQPWFNFTQTALKQLKLESKGLGLMYITLKIEVASWLDKFEDAQIPYFKF